MPVDSSLLKAARSVEEMAYDAQVKRLLSHKEILARILKDCVEEFQDIRVEDIASKYIEGTPEIDVPVEREDSEQTSQIQGINNEDVTAAEGAVLYDIRFYALCPGEEGKHIKLIINVEAQQKDDPGYSLTRRGLYYCARMLSAEKHVEFEKSQYNQLKKVYSIWICYSSGKSPNTMVRYKLCKEDLIGHVDESARNFDLLQVIQLRLGRPQDTQSGTALHMMDVIFSDEASQSEKKNVLKETYKLPMTEAVEKEMTQMCNMSLGVREKALQEGIALGIAKRDKQNAKSMRDNGMPLSFIAQMVDEPEQTVSQWLSEEKPLS